MFLVVYPLAAQSVYGFLCFCLCFSFTWNQLSEEFEYFLVLLLLLLVMCYSCCKFFNLFSKVVKLLISFLLLTPITWWCFPLKMHLRILRAPDPRDTHVRDGSMLRKEVGNEVYIKYPGNDCFFTSKCTYGTPNITFFQREWFLLTFLQSSPVKLAPQDSTNEFTIWKLNPLVVVDFTFISSFLHV